MFQVDGRRTCDHEVGSPKKGWHSCGRPAKNYPSLFVLGHQLNLDLCDRHKKKET